MDITSSDLNRQMQQLIADYKKTGATLSALTQRHLGRV